MLGILSPIKREPVPAPSVPCQHLVFFTEFYASCIMSHLTCNTLIPASTPTFSLSHLFLFLTLSAQPMCLLHWRRPVGNAPSLMNWVWTCLSQPIMAQSPPFCLPVFPHLSVKSQVRISLLCGTFFRHLTRVACLLPSALSLGYSCLCVCMIFANF